MQPAEVACCCRVDAGRHPKYLPLFISCNEPQVSPQRTKDAKEEARQGTEIAQLQYSFYKKSRESENGEAVVHKELILHKETRWSGSFEWESSTFLGMRARARVVKKTTLFFFK